MSWLAIIATGLAAGTLSGIIPARHWPALP